MTAEAGFCLPLAPGFCDLLGADQHSTPRNQWRPFRPAFSWAAADGAERHRTGQFKAQGMQAPVDASSPLWRQAVDPPSRQHVQVRWLGVFHGVRWW